MSEKQPSSGQEDRPHSVLSAALAFAGVPTHIVDAAREDASTAQAVPDGDILDSAQRILDAAFRWAESRDIGPTPAKAAWRALQDRVKAELNYTWSIAKESAEDEQAQQQCGTCDCLAQCGDTAAHHAGQAQQPASAPAAGQSRVGWAFSATQARALAAEVIAGAEAMGGADDDNEEAELLLEVREPGSVMDDDGTANAGYVLAISIDAYPEEGVYPIDPTELTASALADAPKREPSDEDIETLKFMRDSYTP